LQPIDFSHTIKELKMLVLKGNKMKTPIYILSGFLGAGKTTLLQTILKQEKERGRKVAVLMNELGVLYHTRTARGSASGIGSITHVRCHLH
jgi:predicted AAA+ superfamily ATPase